MGESSSADQVYDTKFCQTVSSRLIASVFVWVLTRIIDEGISETERRRTDRGVNRLGLFFDSCTYCFAIEQRTERFWTWELITITVWVTNYARLWVIDDLLINYYRHISTITILFFIFLLCLNLLFVTFAVTNDDSCKKRNDLFCFVWENNFASIWLCVCVCLFVLIQFLTVIQ